MKIKFRLLLSYVAMILIPIVLMIILSVAFTVNYNNDEESNLDIISPGKTFGRYILNQNKIEREVNLMLLKDKEKIFDDVFIKSLEEMTKKYFAGVLIRKDNSIIYVSDIIKNDVNFDELPIFQEEFNFDCYVNVGDGYVINFQNDFYLDDGSEVSIFSIANFDLIHDYMNKTKNLSVFVFISILSITTILLTFFMYRSINKSINKLKYATYEIKKGNLDFEINKHLNDEIGDLTDAFEEMRIKLKESKNIQKKYEENRKNLLSNISHDLKTPIMSIKGYVEGLKDGVANTPEKMDRYINTIYDKAAHMEILINELFLFSKLDMEKEEFYFKNINIIDFLKYSIEDMSFDLEKINGNIELNYEYEPIFIKGDFQKLRRVILNIVGNSIKYRKDENLKIEINVSKQIDNDQIIIEIKDNGKGISKENLQYIFDRFYRADKSRNTSVGGSGLGLAISKQIIEKHGGVIWGESYNNKGTSIFFSLKECKEGEVEDEENINC